MHEAEKELEAVFWRLVGEGVDCGSIGVHQDYRKAVENCNEAGIELWPGQMRDYGTAPS